MIHRPIVRACARLAAVTLLFAFASCSTPSTAAPRPADSPRGPGPIVETVVRTGDPVYTPLPLPETPENRNERLMRLEWAQDQWWAATQRQEYEKQASLEKLLRDYVGTHYDAIASDLQHGSPRHRRTMAMALGFSGRQDAVPLLAEALKDQYYEVVLHALLGLYGLTKEDPSTPAEQRANVVIDPEIVVPYLRHPRPEVRSNAALVLSKTVGRNPQKSLLLPVVAAAEDVDPATRAHAVATLGTSGDREVFPYLVKALGDPVQLVRIRAALALGRLGGVEGVPYLIGVLESKDEKDDVKRAASKALGEIMGTTDVDSLDPAAWRDAARKMGIDSGRR